MFTVRLLLLAVFVAMASTGCSRGPQGEPADAEPARVLIGRLDVEVARLQQLFELRSEVQQLREQLQKAQRELGQDFPGIAAMDSLKAGALPPAAARRVRAFRAGVAEYDRLVARHNQLASELHTYLEGRSPAQVQRLVNTMQRLRQRLAEMIGEADYTRAQYVARNSELVQSLNLNEPQ